MSNNTIERSDFIVEPLFEAIGGFGYGRNAGSGGAIMIVGPKISQMHTKAHGGISNLNTSCSNGAAGTVLLNSRVVVDNHQIQTTK